MEKKITEDNLYRLAIAIMEKYKINYDQAIDQLCSFKLLLNCNEEIKTSKVLQVALITAVNCGRRAFLGGVYCNLPENIIPLFSWSEKKTLNQIITDLGGIVYDGKKHEINFTLNFGFNGDIENNSLRVVCNAWQGGYISSPEETDILPKNESICLGGVLAGGLCVGTAFLRTSGISLFSGDTSNGISLWRPDLNWMDKDAQGPFVSKIPSKFWVLGLGHLGQAYLWAIALLGINNPNLVTVLLQDYDRISEANVSSGLLSDHINIGKFKTRVCASWLEDRNFKTIISERKFDLHTVREGEEPFVALCGFDNAAARSILENAGFDFIVESGLGNKLFNFDAISFHTFPGGSKSSIEIWGQSEIDSPLNEVVFNEFKNKGEDCGILALTLARKAVSSSFVGCVASALVIAETLKSYNDGLRIDSMNIKIRDLDSNKVSVLRPFEIELSRNGFFDNI